MKLTQKIELTLKNGIRYIPLLQNLIERDLKKKYRRSVLGYIWCVLNPLLVMIIMTVVFSRIFRYSIPNFPVYLFAGRMMYSLITDSVGGAMRSITHNGQLIRKTRIPYYIFPLSSMGSSIVGFAFQLIAFAIVLIFTGTTVSVHVISFPLVCLEMFIFSFGFGLLLAVCNMYIRDTEYMYAVFTTAWMYLTPLFYPITALPERLQSLIRNFNPAYFFVEMSRSIFLYNEWPSQLMLWKGAAVALLFLILGLVVYDRTKDTIILYV